MATKRVTINKSDGTSNSFDFTIPEEAGTYNIKFTLDNNTVIDAGNITVNDNVNTYRLSFGLSNGTTVDAGTFTTPAVVGDNYITFSSPSSFSITKNAAVTTPLTGTYEYSTDAVSWIEWDKETPMNSSADGKLYIRGIGNTTLHCYLGNFWSTDAVEIHCTGNIETLLDYNIVSTGEHPVMREHCFAYLFNNWTSLVTAPELPSTDLTNFCYKAMFSGCTSLTNLPDLPATHLPDGCYNNMFYNIPNISLDLKHVISIDPNGTNIGSSGALCSIVSDTSYVHFGPALESVGIDPGSTDPPNNLYFHHSESDPVKFDASIFIMTGTSKATQVYNIYTDNSTIRSQVSSKADSYTTVNVYKLDGGAWA